MEDIVWTSLYCTIHAGIVIAIVHSKEVVHRLLLLDTGFIPTSAGRGRMHACPVFTNTITTFSLPCVLNVIRDLMGAD